MTLFIEIFCGAFALLLVSIAVDIGMACYTMRDQREAIEEYIKACQAVDRVA